jgi:hypothetical protein
LSPSLGGGSSSNRDGMDDLTKAVIVGYTAYAAGSFFNSLL